MMYGVKFKVVDRLSPIMSHRVTREVWYADKSGKAVAFATEAEAEEAAKGIADSSVEPLDG